VEVVPVEVVPVEVVLAELALVEVDQFISTELDLSTNPLSP
jgi:hypothetical protein